MTVDFQENVLRFLCKDREGKNYIKLLDTSAFDLVEHQLAFELLVEYVSKYKLLPKNSVNLVEFFDGQARKQKVSDSVYKEIVKTLKKIYEPYENDVDIVKDKIVEFSQYKQMKLMLDDFSPKLKDGGAPVYQQMKDRMEMILKIGQETALESNRGGFLLQDHSTEKGFKVTPGNPTYLKKLNKMTAAGGFYSPQLIVFMGAPKSFKTGVVLNIAMEYVRDGYKVYWADTENGIRSIKNRAKQKMVEGTLRELISGEMDSDLDHMVMKFKGLKGELVVDYYPANKSSILVDVKDGIKHYKDVHNWEPEIIIYDYLDLFASSNKKTTDKRLIIQDVYHEAVALNVELDTFAISISPVTRKAVSKETLNMQDFGEDFGKAYNAHAAFAICRTDEEMKNGLARIVPVIQREGVPQGVGDPCIVQIDAPKQTVKEVDPRDAALRMQRKVRNEN